VVRCVVTGTCDIVVTKIVCAAKVLNSNNSHNVETGEQPQAFIDDRR
jgi:hypothetical protein